MRKFAAFTSPFLLGLSACSASSDSGEQTPQDGRHPFIFRQFTATISLEKAMSSDLVEDCDDEYQGSVTCRIRDARIGSAESDPILTWMFFQDGVLDWFSIEVRRDQYRIARNSLLSAYGEPCKAGTQALQNEFGAKFDSETARWCFTDGQLTLSERSARNMNFADMTFQRFSTIEPVDLQTPNEL